MLKEEPERKAFRNWGGSLGARGKAPEMWTPFFIFFCREAKVFAMVERVPSIVIPD